MKCVVLAYHNMGCAGIEALLNAGFEISAVFTHRDNPGENIFFDSVAEYACSRGIPAFAPEDINHPVWVNRIKALEPDFIFSFYYRSLLKSELLSVPKQGCINLHGSLLPKYRGRVPINWAIINGEKETGVTLHYMTEKADAGDIIAQKRIEITPCDTAKSVFDKAVAAAKTMLAETLPQIRDGKASRTPQNHAEATVFPGRKPADGEIDWKKSAVEVNNLIRAVTKPYPGAFSFLGDRKSFIWSAKVLDSNQGMAPGTVISSNPLVIACGEGAVEVLSAEFEGSICQTGPQFAAEGRVVPRMM